MRREMRERTPFHSSEFVEDPLKTNPTTRVRVKATCRRRRRQRVELHISTSSAAGCMLEVSQRIFAALSCLPVNDNNEERTIPASDDTAHCATLRVLHPSLHPYHRYTIFETVNSAIIVVNVVNIVIIVRREKRARVRLFTRSHGGGDATPTCMCFIRGSMTRSSA